MVESKTQRNSVTIDGYSCHRLDRKSGVCIYVNNRLQLRRLVLQKTLDFAELIWVRVSCSVNVTSQHFCVCVCYHPPKLRYASPDLISVLQDNLNELLVAYANDVFVIAGDLNQLRYHCLLVDFALSQIVTEPTRNCNILDSFLTSRPDLFDCSVAKSV